MGREYDIDKSDRSKLPLAFGNLPVRGTLVRHESTAVGTDLQVTLQSALGEGEWDGIDRLAYNGADIPAQNYSFHSGASGETAADSIFPNDPNHPNAAFINVRLPVGMAADNDPDKLVGNYRCLKIENYDAGGNATGKNFSRNPARIAAYIIKVTRPRLLNRIDWASWVEWRDWCDAQIQTVVNNQTVSIPRFELNTFFTPPFDLEQILDTICQITCTDKQWRGAKLRFLIPVERPSETFTFDLSKVTPDDYQFVPTDRKSRPNTIVVSWRNFDDEFYKEEEQIIVKRDDLIALDGGENILEINAGICRRNQAERIAHFWAKMRCDATEFCAVVGLWDSYPMLPGNIVKLTHDIPDYNNRRFLIIEKEENEGEGNGYLYKLQDVPANAYSDSDQTPLILHPQTNTSNPFSAPPLPILNLEVQNTILENGTLEKSVKGTVNFGAFGFAQSAKIYWMRPGKGYEYYTEVKSSDSIFKVLNLPAETNWFRAVAVSDLGVASQGSNDASVTITESDFYANGKINAIADDKGWMGNDTGVVPQSAITAKIDFASCTDDVADVLLGVSINKLYEAGNPVHNNSDSVSAIKVDIFNQFGERIISLVAPSNRIGGQVMCKFPRKYADPLTGQCYFQITVQNFFQYNTPIYLQGSTISFTKPTDKVKSSCPLDSTGTPFSATAIRCFYTFSGNVNLLRRKPGDVYFQYHATNISSSPYLADGLAEYSDYEFQFESSSDTSNRGSIFRAKTKQQGEAAPSRPAPTGISGQTNSSNPQSQMDFSCVSAANVETEVFVNGSLAQTIAAAAVGQTINYSISGLSASESRSVKFRHKWGSNDYSAFTEEITRTTNSPAPTETAPFITYASVEEFPDSAVITLGFTTGAGTGDFEVWKRINSGSWQQALGTFTIAGNEGYFDTTQLKTPSIQTIYYKLKRTNNNLWSNEDIYAVIYRRDPKSGGGYEPV